MPIKFACEHCGQVLSVSSTKAGQGAKCPKCHQGITVPLPEAAAASLARRKQAAAAKSENAKSIASALPAASLAEIAAATRETLPPEPETRSAVAPEVIARAVPPPVPAVPPLAPAVEPEQITPKLESLPPGESEDPFSQFVVYDDGTELVYAADADDAYEHDSEVDRNAVAVPRGVLYMQGALLGVVALVCFTLGVLVGGTTMSGKTAGPHVARPCQVTGSVVFRDSRKEPVPDDGSVVILLPQDARPDEKTAVLGLRPEDPTPDSGHSALAAIRSLGGDYARADSEGRFRLRVADTGPYFVLFISRNSKRKAGETFKTADLAQLGRYFSDAVELIGESRYRWKVERISGDRLLSEEFN